MIRKQVIGADQAQSEVPIQVQIETAAGHETDFVIASEDFGGQAMLAHESFEKRRKMAATESYFRPGGKVEEFGIVNSHGDPSFPAAQIRADVARQSEPAVEVEGDAGTGTPRIRFHAAAHR